MSKDVVLYINAIRPAAFGALREYGRQTNRQFTPIVIANARIKASIDVLNGQHDLPEKVTTIVADFDSPESLREALAPYMDRVFAVTALYEECVMELKKLVPYFPYLSMPTESSLEWGTEKKLMRAMLASYDRSLVPGYMEVPDTTEATLDNIEKHIDYPMIVKPSGLQLSLLVTRVNNRKELESTLKRTFHSIQTTYNEFVKRQIPAVLVEEFMVGKKYVIDCHVAADGTCYYNPVITSKRGIEAGYDDFFEYQATLPSNLSEEEIKGAQDAAGRACHALGFRSVTADVELMRTKDGWKIIELAARMGGYSHDMYSLAYGTNYLANDVRVRAGEVPEIPTELKKYVSVFDIYARSEGLLVGYTGLEAVKNLPSFISVRQYTHVGQNARFAKNGGDAVFHIILSHASKEQLDADNATLEKVLEIQIEPAHSNVLVNQR